MRAPTPPRLSIKMSGMINNEFKRVQRAIISGVKNKAIAMIKSSEDYQFNQSISSEIKKKIDTVTTLLKDIIVQENINPKDRAQICLTCSELYNFVGDKVAEKHHLEMAMTTLSCQPIWSPARVATINRYIIFLIDEKSYLEAYFLATKTSNTVHNAMFHAYSNYKIYINTFEHRQRATL